MNGIKECNKFRRMIAQLAWNAWVTLPRQHQIWIGVDDMIEDGMFKAYQIITSKWYDPHKSSVSTAIYHAVHNHLNNEYIKRYCNESRFASLESIGVIDFDEKHRRKKLGVVKGLTPAGMVSIDALADFPKSQQEAILESPKMSTSESTIYDSALTNCFVVPALTKIYKEASIRLRHEMVCWFIHTKLGHEDGRRFRRAAREFREFAETLNLTYYDCLHLVRSQSCMDTLSRELLGVPFLLDYPSPGAERITN